jgi:hypothetical protein
MPYQVPIHPDMVGAHLHIGQPAGGILEQFLQMFHQKLQSNLFIGFPSRILESAVLPTRVDLFLQRKDSMGQPMGSHADSCQALLFEKVDFLVPHGGVRVELALHSRFLGTWRVGQQKGGVLVLGSRSRTMSYAIPVRKFSKEGPESRHEGGFEDLRPQ